jgi:RHS repeat-associated protein
MDIQQKKARIEGMTHEVKQLHPLLDSLFRKLPSVKSVDYNHGSNEMGADFLLSQENPALKSTIYVGVIAKVGKIEQAKAQEVERQVQECFIEKIIARDRIFVTDVWVVTTGHISHGAKVFIQQKVCGQRVEFISGDKLIELIDLYLPNYWTDISLEIGNYLHGVKVRMDEIERSVSLINLAGDVYIEPEISRREREGYQRDGKPQRQPKIAINSVVRRERFIIVEGDMGVGKSKLIRKIIGHLTTPQEYLETHIIPVFTTYKDLIDRDKGDISALLKRTFGDKPITELTVKNKFLLFIDGLDEKNLSGEEQIDCLKRLIESLEIREDVKLFLTTRFLGGLDNEKDLLRKITRLELHYLTPSKMLEFVKRICVAANITKRIFEDIKSSPLFRELPRSPIAAILLANLLNTQAHDLPSNLPELYSKYLELTLGKWDIEKGIQSQKEYEALMTLVTELAVLTIKNELPFITVEEVKLIFENYLSRRNLGVTADGIFSLLKERCSIVAIDTERGRFSFKHRTFAEFLYAKRLVEQNQFKVDSKAFHPYWMNIYYFAIGHLKDCPEVIDALVKISPDSPIEHFLKVMNMGNFMMAAFKTPYNDIISALKAVVLDAASFYQDIIFKRVDTDLDAFPEMHLLCLFQLNIVLTNAYNLNGQLTERWTPAKGKTTYSYDDAGNRTTIDYPTDHDVTFTYNDIGQILTVTDGIGTTTFTYTANGELASEDGPWDQDMVSYTYANGQRTSMTLQQPNASPWVVSYGYDSANRLSTITSPSGTFSYTYQGTDASNARGSMVKKLLYPNTAYVTNSFDSNGRMLSTVLKNSSHTTLNSHSYTYNSGNQRTKQTRTGGDYVDYTYDSIGQLRTAQAKESGGTSRLNEQFGYGYDAAGNLQYRTNNALVHTFNVDSRNQLTSITRSGTLTVAGNTTTNASSVTINGNSATLYGDLTFAKSGLSLVDGNNTFTAIATDANSRKDTNIVTINLPATVNFTYDSNGNLTSEGDRTYTYNDENRLTSVLMTNKWKEEYQYSGAQLPKVIKQYLWRNNLWTLLSESRKVLANGVLVQVRDGDNLALMTFSRDKQSHLTSARADTRIQYLAEDALSNTAFSLDENQHSIAAYIYDPFGRMVSHYDTLASSASPEFAGQTRGTFSDVDFYKYRQYSPSLHRWLTKDPAGFSDGANLFSFLHNSPTIAHDSDGGTTVYSVTPIPAYVPWALRVPTQTAPGTSINLPIGAQTVGGGYTAAFISAYSEGSRWYLPASQKCGYTGAYAQEYIASWVPKAGRYDADKDSAAAAIAFNWPGGAKGIEVPDEVVQGSIEHEQLHQIYAHYRFTPVQQWINALNHYITATGSTESECYANLAVRYKLANDEFVKYSLKWIDTAAMLHDELDSADRVSLVGVSPDGYVILGNDRNTLEKASGGYFDPSALTRAIWDFLVKDPRSLDPGIFVPSFAVPTRPPNAPQQVTTRHY